MTLRVLIAEDHKLVSQGLESMLELAEGIELLGVAATGEEAVDRARAEQPDVVLMDVKLSGRINGIDATRQIKGTHPGTKVLVLTMFTDAGTVAEAVKAGADGYLSKGSSREAVVKAIRDVAQGLSVLDPNVTEGIFGRLASRDVRALTGRELQVLQELAHGLSTRAVADKFHISEETVKTYLKHIYRKLGVRDRTEAVAEAMRRGLIH